MYCLHASVCSGGLHAATPTTPKTASAAAPAARRRWGMPLWTRPRAIAENGACGGRGRGWVVFSTTVVLETTQHTAVFGQRWCRAETKRRAEARLSPSREREESDHSPSPSPSAGAGQAETVRAT